jgi:ferrochelatase
MSRDALLVVSFGGPEKSEDVMPFLRNVVLGRNVPDERLREVAAHYERFGGRSPINDQNRALISALRAELDAHGPRLPIYWGNRNWAPYLADAVRQMQADGIDRAFAFVTSAFSSYSGCRQYLEDIERARAEVGAGAPEIRRLPALHDDPGFLEACAERLRDVVAGGDDVAVVFTAHSIPRAMAGGCDYEAQLRQASQRVADAVGVRDTTLAFQSRSGPPTQPWLEPDVNDALRQIAAAGKRKVAILPIGFLSDHMEVVFDLDVEARATADELGLELRRAPTVGTHPALLRTIRESLGRGWPAACREGCCPSGRAARP